MWRDRTNLYISYRQSYSHRPAKRPRFGIETSLSSDRRGLLSQDPDDDDNGDAVIEMDLLPPRWADVSDEVNEILASITKKAVQLDRLHQKHLLPGFDDNTEQEGEIERLTTDITTQFHECGKSIKKLERLARQTPGITKAEAAMCKNIQISLASKVQDVSSTFRKKQSAYLKKLRGINGMTTPIDRANSPAAPTSSSFLQEEEADVSYSQSTLQQTAVRGSNDAAIMQREREITEIAQGIIELADIVKELQTMVIDQGTMLDRVDFNIENMAVNVKAADKELVEATGYQKKTTKRKIILLLVLLVVGMIILVVIKPKKNSPPPALPPPTPPLVEPPENLEEPPAGRVMRIRGRMVVLS